MIVSLDVSVLDGVLETFSVDDKEMEEENVEVVEVLVVSVCVDDKVGVCE